MGLVAADFWGLSDSGAIDGLWAGWPCFTGFDIFLLLAPKGAVEVLFLLGLAAAQAPNSEETMFCSLALRVAIVVTSM